MCDIITITHVFGCDSCHHFACATSVDKLAVYFVVSNVCVDELVSPDNHCTVQTRCTIDLFTSWNTAAGIRYNQVQDVIKRHPQTRTTS